MKFDIERVKASERVYGKEKESIIKINSNSIIKINNIFYYTDNNGNILGRIKRIKIKEGWVEL